MNTMTYCTNGPDDIRHMTTMTDFLIAIIFCIVMHMITDKIVPMALLILLINILCIMNMLVWVWLL